MTEQTPQRKRKLQGGWLQNYRRYIVKQESPDIFHFWVGCQLISAALRRHVWIDRGTYRVLPNQYVFFVARSGYARKSTAMDIGLDLIRDVDFFRQLYGRMTVEGLIDYLDFACIQPDGKVTPDGSVFIHSDELAYIFGKAAYSRDLIDFLTAAYSGKSRLDFLTTTKGLRTVRNPCITFMAATTDDQLGEIFPTMTLVSGFFARTIIVYGERDRRVAKPMLDYTLADPLIHDLGCISQIFGEIKLTDDADEMFDRWYTNMPHSPISELKSFYERRHDHVLRLAIILSISESNKMLITSDHIYQAVKSIELVEAFYPKAVAYIGATQQSNIADYIEAIIRSVYPEEMSHSVLLRRCYRRMTHGSDEFKMFIEDLKIQGRIKESSVDPRRGIFYQWIPQRKEKKKGGVDEPNK